MTTNVLILSAGSLGCVGLSRVGRSMGFSSRLTSFAVPTVKSSSWSRSSVIVRNSLYVSSFFASRLSI